jgi:hypothetical protein
VIAPGMHDRSRQKCVYMSGFLLLGFNVLYADRVVLVIILILIFKRIFYANMAHALQRDTIPAPAMRLPFASGGRDV